MQPDSLGWIGAIEVVLKYGQHRAAPRHVAEADVLQNGTDESVANRVMQPGWQGFQTWLLLFALFVLVSTRQNPRLENGDFLV